MKPIFLPSLSVLLLIGCQSTNDTTGSTSGLANHAGSATAELDEQKRTELLSSIAALAGRWQVEGAPEPMFVEFFVSSAGSVVREIMFPGSPDEMTNMYSLDANSLTMTHYCSAGNQPHMLANSILDGQMEFKSVGVSDLKSPDEIYMSHMTLVFIDENHIEEIWKSQQAGEVKEDVVIELARVDGS